MASANQVATDLDQPRPWAVVRFGDVVDNVNTNVKDPLKNGLERYVGLDHLTPDSLRIERWGKVADGTTFTRRFSLGQVLFAKRRAYQRKVAVADFEGVCSGDILVLEAKGDLIPELLPLIVSSDSFFEYALRTSAGSLSPRTKWSDLANYELAVPPKPEQRAIARLISAVDAATYAYEALVLASQNAYKAILHSSFEPGNRWSLRTIGEIGEVQMGRQLSPKYMTGRFAKPYLRVMNVLDGRIDVSDVKKMDFEDEDFARYHLKPGDILVTEGDIVSPHNVGRSAMFKGEIANCCFQNTLLRFRAGPDITPDFALAAFRNAFYQGVFAKVATTTTVSHLGKKRFEAIRIPLAPLEVQKRICAKLSAADEAGGAAERLLAAARTLRKKLLASLLEEPMRV